MTTTSPYATYADYWAAGWRGILPLPYQKKTWPPTGYTGHAGVDPSYADCATFADDGDRNICLRMPDVVVGLDVDHYGSKTGGATLTSLVEKHGPLPPTFMSTSREDGISGIRFYRIPAGTVLPTKMPGIDFVQRHHRYAVVWPSLHPEGRTYRWIDERTGQVIDYVPNVGDLPDLPGRWLDGLAVEAGDAAAKADIDGHQGSVILSGFPVGDPCVHVLKGAGRAMAGGDRHDSYNEAVLAVVGSGRRGCPGAMLTIARLQASFISELTDAKHGRASRGEAEAEWQRSLIGALAIVANETQGSACPEDALEWAESFTVAPETTTPEAPSEDAPESPFDRAVRAKYVDLRIADQAKEMLSALRAGQAPPLAGVSLREFLDQPDEEERYRVDDLWPAEGRVLAAAAAKSGKTTLVAANVIPSLVDGRPFLGRQACQQVAGRVVLLNMEVGERTLRRWMRDCGVDAVDRVAVVNLRGRASALALASDAGRRRFAEFLKRQEAEVVILDPLAPVLASLGLDENKNSEVATFFGWWSEALAEAGVVDDLVVHHTGHAGERSRGASRLLDEPDAIWTLTREKDDDEDDAYGGIDTRYLAAYGRDVEMAAEALSYDPATRELTLTGMSRSEVGGDKLARRIRKIMSDGAPRSRSNITGAVGGHRQTAWNKVGALITSGDLQTADRGKTYVFPDAVGGLK